MLTREQYFPGQAPEEQVALFIRRHWMAFFPWMVVAPVVILILITGFFVAWNTTISPTIVADPELMRALLIILASMIVLLLLFITLRAWMSFYLDVTIVTERRLVNIEQEGIFQRRIAEQSLLRVQDVSASQRGMFNHFLNYGNLYIETAGEQPNFELHNIPRPNDVAKTILDLHDRIVGAGGHEVEMAVGEGSLGPMSSEMAQRFAPPRHPLEELRPYFPEPGTHAHHHPLAHPQTGTNTDQPKEGDLAEGETVTLPH